VDIRTERKTRSAERVDRRKDWSRWFYSALQQVGITQERLAEDVGADTCKGARWVSEKNPELPSVADVEAMEGHLAEAVLRRIATKLGFVVTKRLQGAAAPADHLVRMARGSRSAGESHGSLLQALADGVLSDDELREAYAKAHGHLEDATEEVLALEQEVARRDLKGVVVPIARGSR
jgi:hypothetical protein